MTRKIILTLILMLAAGLVQADAKRQAILEARIDAYFQTYADADPGAYATWLKENRTEEAFSMAPVEMRQEMFAFDVERWGGLKVLSVEFPEPLLAVATGQPANGGLAQRFTFRFEDSPPYLIGPMAIGVAVDMPQNWTDLKDFSTQLLAATGVPAFAIGVMKDGKVLDQAVVGKREISSDQSVEPDDTFHWGSIAKSVTGTMIARLVEENLLDWNTTVSEVLGDLPMRDEYRGATIAQLMSHEAGIPAYSDFTEELVNDILATAEGESWTDKRKAFVTRVLMEEPVAAPGEVHVYSNAGITVAGYMAEKVTGKAWQELVQTHVFDPAGMSTAGFGWPATVERANQPHGHFGDSADNYEVMPPGAMEQLIGILAPAGDVRSSLADLLRYGNFHLQGMRGRDGYLKSESVKALHTARENSVPWQDAFYTIGWGHDECRHFEGEPLCHAHNGGAGSFYAEIKILPERNMVLAYMANAAEPSEAIAQDLLAVVYAHFAR